jgi:hypothetical protein
MHQLWQRALRYVDLLGQDKQEWIDKFCMEAESSSDDSDDEDEDDDYEEEDDEEEMEEDEAGPSDLHTRKKAKQLNKEAYKKQVEVFKFPPPSHCQAGSSNMAEEIPDQALKSVEPKRMPLPELAFRIVSEEELNEMSLEILHTSNYSGLSRDLLSAMDAVDHALTHELDPVSKITSSMKQILETGSSSWVNVAEIVSLHHPVRWCTPPHKKCYTLVAAETIRKGQQFLAYIGDWYDARYKSLSSHYTCIVSREDLEENCPLEDMSWEDLAVDNEHQGNISRFLNCCWGRHTNAR